MRRELEWLLVLVIVLGLLTLAIMGDEVFPNYPLQWSIRIIGIFLIITVFALYRRKRLKNL